MTEGAQPFSTQSLITQPADTRPLGRSEPFPFLGRSRELAALRRVLRDARQKCGRAAVVRGEAGIGKTRLLAEIVAHAEEEGFQVLSIRRPCAPSAPSVEPCPTCRWHC